MGEPREYIICSEISVHWSCDCLVKFHKIKALSYCSIWCIYKYKVTYHSTVMSTPSGTIICCLCSLSNSFLKGSCSVHAACLGEAWYGLTPSFHCNEDVPLKNPMPQKTSANSCCTEFVCLALAFLSISLSAATEK